MFHDVHCWRLGISHRVRAGCTTRPQHDARYGGIPLRKLSNCAVSCSQKPLFLSSVFFKMVQPVFFWGPPRKFNSMFFLYCCISGPDRNPGLHDPAVRWAWQGAPAAQGCGRADLVRAEATLPTKTGQTEQLPWTRQPDPSTAGRRRVRALRARGAGPRVDRDRDADGGDAAAA